MTTVKLAKIEEALKECFKVWSDEAFVRQAVEIARRKGVHLQTRGGTLDLTSDDPAAVVVAIGTRTARVQGVFTVANPTPEVLEQGRGALLAFLEMLPDAPSTDAWLEMIGTVMREADGLCGADPREPQVYATAHEADGQIVVIAEARTGEAVEDLGVVINPTPEELREWSQEKRKYVDALRVRVERLAEIFGNPSEHIKEETP